MDSNKIAKRASYLGASAIVNNDNHVTIVGKKRIVQIWTTGTVYSKHVPTEWKEFRSRKFHPIGYAVEQAVTLANKGYLA